jgi:hypothetical protein
VTAPWTSCRFEAAGAIRSSTMIHVEAQRRAVVEVTEQLIAAVGKADGERILALAYPDSLVGWEERMPGAPDLVTALTETFRPVAGLLGRSTVDSVVFERDDLARVTLTHPDLPGRDVHWLHLVDGRWLFDLDRHAEEDE